MTRARSSKIRQSIKAGRYFEVLGQSLEAAERMMKTRRERAERLLARMNGDMRFLQVHFALVKKRARTGRRT